MREQLIPVLHDGGSLTLEWRILQQDQLWQAVHGPYLCTVVRSLDAGSAFYATIVCGADLYVAILEDATALDLAQAWCAEQIHELGIGD